MKTKKKYPVKHRKHRKYYHGDLESKLMAQKLIYKAKCRYLQDVVKTQSEIIDILLKK